MLAANTRRGLVCVLMLFIVSLGACSPANVGKIVGAGTAVSSPAVFMPQAKPFPNAAQLNAYLTHLTETGVLSGSVLVAEHGMLFNKGYGLADKDARIPNTPQTRFRIGSLTKQFTAMAILILQESGKLHVQDHLCQYITDCPADWQSITLVHLLTHSSGIPDYTNFSDFVETWTQPTTPEQLIARFKNQPLDFPL